MLSLEGFCSQGMEVSGSRSDTSFQCPQPTGMRTAPSTWHRKIAGIFWYEQDGKLLLGISLPLGLVALEECWLVLAGQRGSGRGDICCGMKVKMCSACGKEALGRMEDVWCGGNAMKPA